MVVAVFGATGFVGTYLLRELIAQGVTPRILVSAESQHKIENAAAVEIISGDIEDADALNETISGCDAIIYLIGIIREFPKQGITFQKLHFEGVVRCIEAASNKEVPKFILMSANGVKENGTPYQTTKWQAERALIQSGLDYTIFRPSLIFGDPMGQGRPEFCTQIQDDMLSLPLPAPLFYSGLLPFNAGKFELSPIHVKNVAQFFAAALTKNNAKGKIFHLGGTTNYSWKEILKTIAIASGKRVLQIPVPVFVVKSVAALLGGFNWFPVTKDQLTMLLEGNTVSDSYFETFHIEPIEFRVEELLYLHPDNSH